MQTAKKKRNVAIELWRFLIAFAIIGFHTGWIIAMSCDGSLGYWMERSNWFFGSSEVLLIFTVTAGYFMVSHFTNRKNDQLYMSRSASSRYRRSSFMIPVTSSAERFQFSVEKAYTVRYSTPSVRQ